MFVFFFFFWNSDYAYIRIRWKKWLMFGLIILVLYAVVMSSLAFFMGNNQSSTDPCQCEQYLQANGFTIVALGTTETPTHSPSRQPTAIPSNVPTQQPTAKPGSKHTHTHKKNKQPYILYFVFCVVFFSEKTQIFATKIKKTKKSKKKPK